jgi:hypothetical protein
MEMHIKIGLGALFGCGIAAAVCAAVKTKELSTLTATSDLTCEGIQYPNSPARLTSTIDQLASLNIWAS